MQKLKVKIKDWTGRGYKKMRELSPEDIFTRIFYTVIVALILYSILNWLWVNRYLFVWIDRRLISLFLILIPTFLIILIVARNKIDKRRLGLGELLAVASIVIAIFFFIYQDMKISENMNIAIDGVNVYNCETACNIFAVLNELENKGDKFTANYFERDFYLKNIDFIAKKYNKQKGNFLSAVYAMGSANRMLDLMLRMNTGDILPSEFFVWRNQDILSLSESIIERVPCNCGEGG